MTVRLRAPRAMAAMGAMALAVGLVGACGSGDDSTAPNSTAGDSTAEAPAATGDATAGTDEPQDDSGDDIAIDPATYRSAPDSSDYYFQTESGNVYCGINGLTGAGCQTTGAPLPENSPSQLADCWYAPGGPSSGARIAGGSASFLCFNQGVFIGPPPTGAVPEGAEPDAGGGEILPAGSALVIDTYTCEAQRDAVTCRDGSNGFTLGPEIAEIF